MTLLKKISQILKAILEKLLQLQKEADNLETANGRKLYAFASEHLGESFVSDIDFDGDVDDEDYKLGCAISVNNICEKALGFPITQSRKSSTYFTYEALRTQNKFKLIEPHNIHKGDIIISPTGFQKNGLTGHIGICLENHLIASNNSFGEHKGKFTQNYTLANWTKNWSFTRVYRIL